MQALAFWKTVTVDRTNLLERLVGLLSENGVRYCVVGGQAVNAYVEPLVSLDLDLVVAAEDMERMERLLPTDLTVKRFPHSLDVSQAGSDLRVQFQTDPRYASFLTGAETRSVLGMALPVASLKDILRGKVWAAQDPGRRPSKRQKDLADISRLLESYPHLRDLVPEQILQTLL